MRRLFVTILHVCARRVVQRYNPAIIAITGSVGKTTTKEAIYFALKRKYIARRSRGNFNTDIGLPLTVLDIGWLPGRSPIKWIAVFLRALSLLLRRLPYPEVLVLEMGADKPGDIAQLVAIAPPRIGIITTIAAAHTERFGDLAGVAKEKGALFKAVGADGWIVVNRDDAEVVRLAQECQSRRMTYGLDPDGRSDVYATDIHISQEGAGDGGIAGMAFNVHLQGAVTPILFKRTLGRHWTYPALAAIAVASILEVPITEAAEGLSELRLEPGRMRVLAGIKHTTIIDDTYNASPISVKAALEAVAELSHEGVVIAVLGDMLELGRLSEEEHKKIGMLLVDYGATNVLVTVGERARDIARGARSAGMGSEHVFEFDDAKTAGLFVQRRMEQGDLVLVKGSRGMKMERIVKEIMAEPRAAKELLVH
ncbi:MAG: UDP-N-acetylmuramoyl-tripeptide--D-alanyl-D-alanine ligase [Patescibacteria group bacterium]|nr:UDP-N-acetylmuramoyl-tripeptide--D-alanyl-D-alanine ligase [Patescibacteria group bacterium]